MPRTLPRIVPLSLSFSLGWAACTSLDRPPRPELFVDAGTGEGGLIIPDGGGPPDADAPGFCGNQILPAVIDRPNLYFVLDRSLSMADAVGSISKYATACVSIRDVLRVIGPRVSYGAAIFPAFQNASGCAPGEEVFPVTRGDPPSSDPNKNPESLQNMLRVLGAYVPQGATPTAATFAKLAPGLRALPGRTAVILATDGGPNCNGDLRCGVGSCMLNIEGYRDDSIACTGWFNCCDPANISDGPLSCIDDQASVDAIAALADSGIKSYIVGLPGSATYADVLNRFADAGQTARAGDARYYATNDQDELTQALTEIAGRVVLDCTIKLGQKPPDSKLVNVYFDSRELHFNENNGWVWIDDTTLEIRGEECDRLKNGEVGELHVVAGCVTVVE